MMNTDALVKEGFKHITNVTKVGNFSQLGGDFVLGPGASSESSGLFVY